MRARVSSREPVSTTRISAAAYDCADRSASSAPIEDASSRTGTMTATGIMRELYLTDGGAPTVARCGALG